jgi:hypothetical protein
MDALSLDDARWAMLSGGFRPVYDASIPLRALAHGAEPGGIWAELWNELYHQGTIGVASYAAIPALIEICTKRAIVDWNLFSLAGIIEVCRRGPYSPEIPDWLASDYHQAWERLFELGLSTIRTAQDEIAIRSILGVLALHRGQLELGQILVEGDSSEIGELYRTWVHM